MTPGARSDRRVLPPFTDMCVIEGEAAKTAAWSARILSAHAMLA